MINGKFAKTNKIWSVFRVHENQINSSGILNSVYDQEVKAIQEKFCKDSGEINMKIKRVYAGLLAVNRKFITLVLGFIF
jgi:hypothetical protein